MMRRTKHHFGLSRVLICLGLLCMLAAAAITPAVFAQPRSRGAASHGAGMSVGPVAWPSIPSRPQGQVNLPAALPRTAQMQTAATRITSPILDLKLLVIAADGTEPGLTTIEQALKYLGTPYTVWIATQHPNALNAAALFNGTHSFYQGVILTTGSLNYTTDGGVTFKSALSAPEWQALWDYESAFGLRQATWYTLPTPDYGFGTVSTPVTSTLATLTAAGQAVFPYINATNPITISNAYTYLAPAVAGASTTTLLSDPGGNALAVTHVYTDGRENLALTFDGNQYLVHAIALSYGVINWVTKGLHLGEMHTYIGAQVDDLFLGGMVWTPTTPCGTDPETTGVTFRTTIDDIQALVNWQQQIRTQPTTQQLRLDMTFNGSGAVGEDQPVTDTLVPNLPDYKDNFKWINHTWDHLLLNDVNYITATQEIAQNDAAATVLGLSPFSVKNIVTPEISGLFNPQFMQAAYDQGIRYMVSDTSKPVATFVLSNTGTYSALQPSIFMIPRRPTNQFYNVSLPEEWVAEYNCLYRAYWGRDLTYEEILTIESDTLLQYLLKGERYPWMFHQPNLRAYDGTHSLLSDLIDRTLAKYNRIYNLPIQSPTMDVLGQMIADRTNYGQVSFPVPSTGLTTAALQPGFTASIVPGASIAFQSTKPITVPVTGLPTPNAELYAGQKIANYALGSNQRVVVSLTTGLDIPQHRVYMSLLTR